MAAPKAVPPKSALLAAKAGLLQSLQNFSLQSNYIPARLPEGKVVGIWGEAIVRMPDGEVRELRVGDMVRKGHVILTSQNGIVQLEVDGNRYARLPEREAPPEPTGAGLTGGEDGSLDPGLRVVRVAEVVSAAEFDFATADRTITTELFPTDPGSLRPASVDVGSATVDERGGHAVFTVSLSRASDAPVTLQLALADGTARGAGVDYGSTGPDNLQVSLDGGTTWVDATTVTLPPGATSVLVRTPVVDDARREGDETFTLTATVAAGDAEVRQPVGTATIVDDEPMPQTQAIDDVRVNEAAGTATFTVTLSTPSDQTVSVAYATADGTAVAGTDYTAVRGVLVFQPGETTRTVTVPILNDRVFEGAETFTLNLSDPVNATVTDPTGLGTILDDGTGIVPPGVTPDDDRPHVASVSSPTAEEGQPLDFTVTLTNPSSQPLPVTVVPRGDTGTLDVDTQAPQVSFDGGVTFVPVVNGVVSVPPGVLTFIVRVPTVDDDLSEPTEQIRLDVATPHDPTPVTEVGRITDDDAAVVSISGPALVNEAAGTATYTITLAHPNTLPVTVRVNTENGTAQAGSDYTGIDQVITFAPGETVRTVQVPILNDATPVFEGREDYTVRLSAPTNAMLGTPSVTTQISDEGTGAGGEDNDMPGLRVDDVSVNEAAGTAVFTVTLVGAAAVPVTVGYSTTPGTASPGTDYTPVSGTLTFAPGVQTRTIEVPILNDAARIYEGPETFNVLLASPTNARLIDPSGLGTIQDDGTGIVPPGVTPDDDRPTASINDVTVNEVARTATFTVTLSNASTLPVTMSYASADGTARAGSDYEAVGGVLTFAPGELTRTITVPILNDAASPVYEGPETFTIQLGSPTNVTFADPTGLGTIVDDGTGTVPVDPRDPVTPPPDDDRPRISIDDRLVNEASATATFTVTLSNPSALPVTVAYVTAPGTATPGSDYTPVSGTLTFGPGELTKTIVVPILNDAASPVHEGAETFTINLSSPTNAVIADPSGLGTIVDDGTGTVEPDPLKPVPPTPDDDRPELTITSMKTPEGSGHVEFALNLSNPSTQPVSVALQLAAGTATGGGVDFGSTGPDNLQVSADGGLTWVNATSATFAPGTRQLLARTPLVNDRIIESEEALTLTATTAAGATRSPVASGEGRISDDDVAPTPRADVAVTPEDTPVAGNVLANDTDLNRDPLTVTAYSVAGVTYPAGTPAVLPGIGQIVIGADGAYVFTPALNYNGPVPVITYTVTDGANPVESTLTLSVTPVNDAPVVGTSQVTVSEEGLAGGLADSVGNPTDTHNSAIASNTLSITDPDSAAFTITWASVPTGLYSQGTQVDYWTGIGTRHLVGKIDGANGATVLEATISDSGTYTVTLHRSISHSGAGEDVRTLDLGVNVVDSGGAATTSQIRVNVEDDSPAAIATQVRTVRLQDTNLMITLDTSGSMDSVRLSNARQAIKNLINSYDEFGDVAVRMVTFADTATDQGGVWLSPGDALSLIDGLIALGGRTNYDAAIALTRTAFETAGRIPSGQNVAYFISDGNPNEPGASAGMDAAEETAWRTFLNAHDMRAYAIGVTNDVALEYLQPIAWDGRNGGSDASAVVVADPARLTAVLQQTVPIPSGELTTGGRIGAGGMVGADGGYIRSVTVDGITYQWTDPRADRISVTGGTGVYAFDTTTKTLTVGTSGATLVGGQVVGGRFIIDLNDGTYEYRVPSSLASDRAERMTYTVSDIDFDGLITYGDTQSGEVVVHVGTSTSTGTSLTGDATRPDSIVGGLGHDTLSGLGGSDTLSGGTGNDTLAGGDGNDWLFGGVGSDMLAGGLGSDVFAWSLNDSGSRGRPAVDTITDFDTAPAASGGDIIDLRDMLTGEAPGAGQTAGNLENFLDFSFAGNSTTIHISSTGGFTGGVYSAGAEDQTLVLSGVDLRAMVPSAPTPTDAQIISALLTQGKLVVDPASGT